MQQASLPIGYLCLNCSASFLLRTVGDGRDLNGVSYARVVSPGAKCAQCRKPLPEEGCRELDAKAFLAGARKAVATRAPV
jgi:DNA-directed RNA polymerase subunit RPC12/RpoP